MSESTENLAAWGWDDAWERALGDDSAPARIIAVEGQSSVYVDLFGMSVDAEGIAVPNDYVGHLPWLE